MRIDKVNELIKQELSRILLEEIEFGVGVMVTVSSVDTSKNLADAKGWISVFPEDKAEKVLVILNGQIGSIQKILNKRLSLRFVPKITFKIDRSGKYVSEIEKVFEEIEGD